MGRRRRSSCIQTELPLASAQLAFRGYPEQIDGKTPGDLTYNYQHISQTGPFTRSRGSYTRYGEVTPLLKSVDEKFVIFGSGEDIDLEFSTASLPPLPPGWKRDYFFYANGFVKDMDFYEASPFTVADMPFHGMSTYPYPASEHYPQDEQRMQYRAGVERPLRLRPGRAAIRFSLPAASDAAAGGQDRAVNGLTLLPAVELLSMLKRGQISPRRNWPRNTSGRSNA